MQLRRPWPKRLINQGGGGGVINVKSTLARATCGCQIFCQILRANREAAIVIGHADMERLQTTWTP